MITTNDERNREQQQEQLAEQETWRRVYAGLAMQGLIIADLGDHERLAGEAVAYADALLTELAKERP